MTEELCKRVNHIIVLVLLSDDNPEHDEPMFQDLGHAFVRYNLQQHDITNNPHAHTHQKDAHILN